MNIHLAGNKNPYGLDFAELVSWRRYFHKHPELSFHEEQTSARVADMLSGFGLEVQTGIGGYGVTACLKGSAPGPVVGLRADMDGLPIHDEKTVDYRSEVPGTMHACGHDGHMTMLLGAAKFLASCRDKLAGEVRFIFQPAEECAPGGAIHMIEDGCLEGVDYIYGIHLWSGFPTGTVSLRKGPVMASADHFDLLIQGKGGHGAIPQQTVDTVVVGSQAVVQLQQIISRRLSPLEPAVLTVGSFHAGNIYNVIADQARLKGTVRCFRPELRDQIKQLIEQTMQGVCTSFGASYKLDYTFGYPPVFNHNREVETFSRSASKVVGDENVVEMEPLMVGEDFGRFLEHVPGCFAFVGSGNPGLSADYPHHHPKFDLDEQALTIGVNIWIQLVLDHLRRG